MTILPELLIFEWDEGNAEKSLKKHGITNKEAEEVFVNQPLLIFDDIAHSRSEKRFQSFGKTDKHQFLFVVFTIRKEKIRIISVRIMDKQERRIYEKAKTAQKNAGI